VATITTTTNATPLSPGGTLVDRSQWTGNLYVMVKASAADTYQLWESRDAGATWTNRLSLVRTNIVEIGSVFVLRTPYDILTWVYRTNESSQDRIYYRQITGLGGATTPPPTIAWDTEKLISGVANGGVASAIYQGLDHVDVTIGSYNYTMIVVGTTSGANVGITMFHILNQSLHVTSKYLLAGSGRVAPTIDIEHVGDAKQSSTPNLWVSWSKTNVYISKLPWIGSGWSVPASPTTLVADASGGYSGSLWDGSRYLTAVRAGTQVTVYQRDRANSVTTSVQTPAHPQGTIVAATLSYNGSTGDLRVFAVGTSTQVLYYVDYIRGTSSWGAWTQVLATAILGTPASQFTVRRSTNGNIRYDVVTAHSGAPNSIVHTQQVLQYAPSTPTWDLTASSIAASGQAADVAAALVLDWNFNDIDPADTQSNYAVSRQIGTGTIAYFRASDSTWQATEQMNPAATTSLSLAAGWGTDADANHTYRVKVWDSVSQASGYSDPLVVVASAKDNPTITAPTAAQVLTVSTVTTTWTVATQTQFRLKLLTNPGGVLSYDTGWIAGSGTTYQIPMALDDQTGWTVQVQTKNDEGLASTVASQTFSINLIEPAGPSVVVAALSASGVIRVTVTNPAPTGAQPALVSQDVYRRPFLYDVINSNPFFETAITDWTGVSATVTRSTTQFHSGVAAARIVPAGAILNTYMESGFYTVDPTLAYSAEAWIRFDTANKFGILRIDWYTAANAFISSSLVQVQPIAGAWVFQLLPTQAAPATTAKAKLVVGVTGTPASTDAIYADEVKLRRDNPDRGAVAASSLAGNVTYDDWQARSGVEYEYRVVTLGANGGIGLSPWTQ
jgi:hypothetical protein